MFLRSRDRRGGCLMEHVIFVLPHSRCELLRSQHGSHRVDISSRGEEVQSGVQREISTKEPCGMLNTETDSSRSSALCAIREMRSRSPERSSSARHTRAAATGRRLSCRHQTPRSAGEDRRPVHTMTSGAVGLIETFQ